GAAQPTSTPLGVPAPVRPLPPDPRELARVVVIDAGHGGRDAGAVGPGGVREKDVTLGIALRLAALLRGRPGYEVHLTRSTDTLIALFDRPRLANGWKDGRPAALFLSIHANSSRDSDVQGFETFILSEARTADERAVAERENAAASYDAREDAPDQDEMSFILSDLRNEFYVHASHDLASLVQGEIASFHRGPDRGVKQAPFVVLVGAYMPAVLVETAFVSNASESRTLASSAFQDRTAMALSRAVDDFFDSHAYLTSESEP
ncbi:MAG TPA: N-acetylmuramoyl-L-alanine amidase, partial [Longimicrobiales bacterium]|nr:N-acetylmuramoyl-L-alanine amidase [Longimicrobiales bacterium]